MRRELHRLLKEKLSPEQLELLAIWLEAEAEDYETTPGSAAVRHSAQKLRRIIDPNVA